MEILFELAAAFWIGKGQELIRLDRFGYGFLFAFAMSLVRFIWGNHG